MTIENGWLLWLISFLSLVGAFHIIAVVFKWLNEHFDFRALIKFLPLLLVIACSGGGGSGGGDSDRSVNTPPEIKRLRLDPLVPRRCVAIDNCINDVFIQPPDTDLAIFLDFDIFDPDLDAKKFYWQVVDQDGNILDEDILDLPKQDTELQKYVSDKYFTDEVGGPYTFTAYVVDKAGNESEEWIEEFCILADRWDTTTCEDWWYSPL